jgi:fructoselysine-6-P-deglycase FrlB-like protein
MPDPAAFLADVLAEPETLAGVLDTYTGSQSPLDALGSIVERRVLFLGMGSSRYAALAACSLLRAHGVDAHAEYASTAAAMPPAEGTLVVAVSAGGTTPETIGAATRHSGTGRVVAVTNRPAEALGAGADVTLPLLAGEEAGEVACKTYQATLAVLLLLCGRVAGVPSAGDLRPAVAAGVHLRDTRQDWVPAALAVLGGGPISTIAPVERLASAEQSALMLREGPRIHAAACETGDWLHVDVYLSRPPGYRAVLFPGSRFDGELMRWIARRGAAVVAIGQDVPGAALSIGYPGARDPMTALLVETMAVELLAAELWRRSLA